MAISPSVAPGPDDVEACLVRPRDDLDVSADELDDAVLDVAFADEDLSGGELALTRR